MLLRNLSITAATLLLVFTSSSSLAETPSATPATENTNTDFLSARVDVGGKFGNERNIGVTEFWYPITQSYDQVVYGDLRLMHDDGSNNEFNLGLGVRNLVDSKYILGFHGWLDKRSTNLGGDFYQTTLGAEFLTLDFDFRTNIYLPLSGNEYHATPNIGSNSPYLAGNGIYYDTNGLLVEEPQKGIDAEVGFMLPILKDYADAIRLYGGGYAFKGDRTDDVIGARARLTADINPWLSVGGRIQHDDERGTQSFLEATLRLPISSKKMIRTNGLRARMDESPERDVDIVTGGKVVDSGLAKAAVNAETGQVQRVLYVDNTASSGGTGAKDNPYNDLKVAESHLQDGDVLYVAHGDGTVTNQNQGLIINKDNITLIGSGADFVWDSSRFVANKFISDGTVLITATAAPVITNVNPTVDTYTGNGILVTGINATIAGVTIDGATRGGINVRASKNSDSLNIYDVTVKNNLIGMSVRPEAGFRINSINISDSTVSYNGTAGGMFIAADLANSSIGTITIDNVIATHNQQNGISLAAANGGMIDNIIITNNTSTHNSAYGIGNQSYNSSKIGSIIIEDNIVTDNIIHGIAVTSYLNGETTHASILNNTVSHNTQNGMHIASYTGGTLGMVDIVGNDVNTNGRNGIYLSALFDASANNLTASLSHNIVTGNGTASVNPNNYYGIFIDDDSTGTFNVDLGGGSLNSEGNNSIYNNFYRDLFIDTRPSNGTSTHGTIVAAQHNWWGVNTGLNQAARATFDNGSAGVNGSRIDASNFLTSNPN